MNRTVLTLLLIAVALAAGVLVGQRLGTPAVSPADAPAGEAEREILYWVAPMDPNFRRDGPGKSPMGMDLVPVYADEAGSGQGVEINPAVVNNLGVRTAQARVRPLWRRIEATGYVGFDETRISHVNLRTQGWIVDLRVNAEGERVRQGDLLFELYSPELLNAQKEFLQAHQRGDQRLKRGAEEKLRALGMISEEVRALESTGKVREHIRVVAPQDGIVTALNAREGMFVQPNTTVMSLADLATVWLQAKVFESQADWVAAGQATEARLDYMPGTVFSGQVDYVYPVLDPATRTLRVRLRFENPDERLKPNMYARVSIYGKLRPRALTIPREALIRAPGRDRVVLALGDGRFDVHEVLTGMESGEWVEIVAGIEEGDSVVTSAQFLIDSEASLAGSIHRLGEQHDYVASEDMVRAFASGWVREVNPAKRTLRVSHGPIDDLGWPGMTMDFEVDEAVDLGGVQAGQDIQFVLRQGHDGEFTIEQLRPQDETVNRAPGSSEAAETVDHQHVTATPAPEEYMGMATVREVMADDRLLKLRHGPIEALGWPAMTMNFGLLDEVDVSGLEPGQEIHFVMRKVGERFLISEIHAMDSGWAGEGHQHD